MAIPACSRKLAGSFKTGSYGSTFDGLGIEDSAGDSLVSGEIRLRVFLSYSARMPREQGGFHCRAPRLWQCFHPAIQFEARGGDRSFGMGLATAVLRAVPDDPLVHIQADVIHRFHGGASLVSLNQRPPSSAFLHQTLLLRPIHSNFSGSGSP